MGAEATREQGLFSLFGRFERLVIVRAIRDGLVLVYLPFVRMLDRQTVVNAMHNYDSFMDFFKENEQELAVGSLLERGDVYADFAKDLCAELRDGLKKGVVLYYQPQYHYDGRCIGVEALLRWRHPTYGVLYPPLVIKLAEEGGFLPELEKMVLDKALEVRPRILEQLGPDVEISVNVTGSTVTTPEYLEHCRQLNAGKGVSGLNICVEVTEQSALSLDDDALDMLRSLRQMGFKLAIDDFSMGQTSVHYLKNSLFDLIKLDGSLVRGVVTNQNCREIIASITQLADSLGLTVLAEFVEDEAQRELLHSIGCDCYQGYLYSPAVSFDVGEG
jgi:EAL domain-containing protein (putative c-di-GMP-specific phosphodiesterase class I)